MNPIHITITGRLGDEPRTFTTHNGTIGVELRLALEVPARIPGADSVTRWVKVIAFGPLAERTATSVGKGDRITVVADDLMAEAWKATSNGEPRARVTLRAQDIAASMAFDSSAPATPPGRPPGPRPPMASRATCPLASRPRRGSCPASPRLPDLWPWAGAGCGPSPPLCLAPLRRFWKEPLMTSDNPLLERVRKLLAKAEAQGVTPAEAEALTAKAAELMARYGIDRALLAAQQPETDHPADRKVDVDNPWARVQAHLLCGLASAMRCQCVILPGSGPGTRIHIFGFASDIERAAVHVATGADVAGPGRCP